MTQFTIYCMDVLEALKRIEPESVDCCMFSPPYWGLRSYLPESHKLKGKEIGLEPHPREYIKKMVEVMRGVRHCLKPIGSCWANIGDTYFGSWGNMSREQIKDYPKGRPPQSYPQKDNWLQSKQKLLMPHRLAIALQEDGWVLRNDVVWHKPSHMPSSVRDRLTCSFEFVFHFVKSNKPNYFVNQKTRECVDRRTSRNEEGIDWQWVEHSTCKGKGCDNKRCVNGKVKESFWRGIDYFYDLDAIREKHLSADPARKGDYARLKAGNRFEYKGKFGKKAAVDFNPSGKNPGDAWQPYDTKYEKGGYGQSLQGFTRDHTTEETRRNSRIEAKQMFPDNPRRQQEYINFIHDHLTHPLGRNPGDFWRINPKPFKGAHFSCFPPTLVERPLLATCPKQVCVKCGKPRERITKVVGKVPKGGGASLKYAKKEAGLDLGSTSILLNKEATVKGMIGWSKCSCNAGFRPGVVLDPFVGSGTTLMVAKEMGLRGIGIELNPDYIKLIRKRLFGDAKPDSIGKDVFEVITK